MPPVRRRPLGIFPREITWHVGSDDFTLPSLFAIVSRLILLGLTLGTLVYLLLPTDCEDESATIPPLFYISLSIFNLVLFFTIVNEGVIFSLSLRGRIHDTANTRKYFPCVVEVRVALMFIEILTLIVTSVGTFDGNVGGDAIECGTYRDKPLVFAKVIVSLAWVLTLALGVALVIGLDPLGFCSPSFIDEIKDSKELGKELDEEGFIVPGKIGHDETVGRRRKTFHVELGHRKIFRRLQALLCCVSSSTRSSGVAMQDAAKALHTVFGDLNIVPTDVVAGLILLKRDQRRKKENCSCPVCLKHEEGSCEAIITDLRELTFAYMPKCQKPEDYVRQKQRPFNFDDPLERALFEDVHHYMGYSMGMYGWSLHVFQNPLTGFFHLASNTCCRCSYRCTNPRAGVDIVNDDVCLCGLATMRIQSKRPEEDIVYASYQNDIYQIPFSIAVDHERKTVVLSVRGTLSIKDVLTDVSVSMVKVRIPGIESEELYMHNGMYRTAQWIKSQVHTRQKGEREVLTICESRENVAEGAKEGITSPDEGGKKKSESGGEGKQILRTTMQKYWDYKLVVTGHSLGAGAASILSVLLKPAYPHLHCYAYSPPGCIFSLPVAQHSESFITSTVLGNDMISRISFRALLYMKKQVEHLLTNCHKPKSQVLFQGRKAERIFSKVTEDPTVSLEDVKQHLIPDQSPLGIREIVLAKKFAKKIKQNLQRRKTLHLYVNNINGGDHIASFPPGRILHMELTRKAKPLFLGLCYPNEMKLTWKGFEDLSTISVDKGMVEDHLPTAVMAGLKRIKEQFVGHHYDPKETERIRIDAHDKYRQRATALRRRNNFAGESFEGGSSGRVNKNQAGYNGVNGSHTELGDHRASLQEGTISDDVHHTRHTVDVAVTLEEERPNEDSSGHRPQDAKAQALEKPKATPTTFFGQPALGSEEIALEMGTL
jgi:sn1-specific diacylglycerol lipase